MINRPTLFETKQQFKRAPIYYAGVIAFALFPLILAVLSSFISELRGCQVNEAGTGNCGLSLDVMFTAGWFALLTIPLGIIAFIALSIIMIHDYLYHYGKAN
jgi:hypothetical protein